MVKTGDSQDCQQKWVPLLRFDNRPLIIGFALSGSNQARKGRLVDALAARGDEGRDTLR